MVTENSQPRKLFRSGVNRMIGGICGGVAEFVNVDPTVVRVLWVLTIFVNGFSILAYLICLVLIPENPFHDKLPKSAKSKSADAGLVVGIVLLIAGLAFLYRRSWDFPWLYDWNFWHLGPLRWRHIGPVVLIFLGVWIIISVLQNEKQRISSSEILGEGSAELGRRFLRSRRERMIAGVCGGMANYWGIDVTLVRVGYVLLTFTTGLWLGILAYAAIVMAVQEEPTKVEMAAAKEPEVAVKKRRPRRSKQENNAENKKLT